MFYDTEFLSKKRDGLAIYWLASTIGTSNARFKKLAKKDLLKADVKKACNKLINPEEPLALRLSSNLMLGVTRVYNQQCILLHQDTSSTHAALSKAIIQLKDPTTGAALHAIVLVDPNTGAYKRVQGGIGGIDQDLNAKGKSDAINLGVRKEDAVLNGIGLGLFGGLDDNMWDMLEEQMGRRELRPRGRENSTPMLDSDDAFETHSVAGMEEDDEYYDALAKKKRKGKGKDAKIVKKEKATIAKPEDINLPAHQLDLDYELNQMDDQLPGMAFDMLNENPDFELGLEDIQDLPPPLPRGRSSSAGFLHAPGSHGGPATSTAGGAAFSHGARAGSAIPQPRGEDGPGDMWNELGALGEMNNYDGNLDLGLDEQRAGSPIPRFDDENGAGENQLDGPAPHNAQDRQSTPRNRSESALPTPPNSAEQALKAAKAAAAAKRKRAKKIAATIQDGKIMLDSDDLVKARDAYSIETRRQNEDCKERKYAAGEEKRARGMMGNPPRNVGAEELVNFFKTAFDLSFLAKKPAKADKADIGKKVLGKRTRTQDEEDDAAIDVRQRQREGTEVESNVGRNAQRAPFLQPGFEGQDYGQNYDNNFNDGYGYGDFPAKRESSVAPPPYGRADSVVARDLYENESNVGRDGRERAASASYYSQQRRMPWMEPFDGDDHYYDAAVGPGGNSSSMREISIGSKSRIGSPNITRIRSPSVSISLRGSVLKDMHARKSATPLPGRLTRAGTPLDEQDMLDDGLPPALNGSDRGVPGTPQSGIGGKGSPGSGTGSGTGSMEMSQASVDIEAEEGNPGKIIKVKEETARFLDYARRQSRKEENGMLLFSDIVPIASTDPHVAAAAFYQLLVLASKNVMIVEGQEEPYGEIMLSMR